MATESSWYDFETCCSAEVVKKCAFSLECAINALKKEDDNYLDLKENRDIMNVDVNLTSEIKLETKAVPTPKVFSFKSSDLTQIVEHLRVSRKCMESKKISNDQELIQSDPTSCLKNQKGNN